VYVTRFTQPSQQEELPIPRDQLVESLATKHLYLDIQQLRESIPPALSGDHLLRILAVATEAIGRNVGAGPVTHVTPTRTQLVGWLREALRQRDSSILSEAALNSVARVAWRMVYGSWRRRAIDGEGKA
jgi:hypothetical protein